MAKRLYEQEHYIECHDWVELEDFEKTVGAAIAPVGQFRMGGYREGSGESSSETHHGASASSNAY